MKRGFGVLVVFLLAISSFVCQIAFISGAEDVSGGENGAVDGSTGVYFTVDEALNESGDSVDLGVSYSLWKIIGAVILILVIIFVICYVVRKKGMNRSSRYSRLKK